VKEDIFEICSYIPNSSWNGVIPDKGNTVDYHENVARTGYQGVALIKNRYLMRTPEGRLFYLPKENYFELLDWCYSQKIQISDVALRWVIDLESKNNLLLPNSFIEGNRDIVDTLSFGELEYDLAYTDVVRSIKVIKKHFNAQYDYYLNIKAGYTRPEVVRGFFTRKDGTVMSPLPPQISGVFDASNSFVPSLDVLAQPDYLFINNPVSRYCIDAIEEMTKVENSVIPLNELCRTVSLEQLTLQHIPDLLISYAFPGTDPLPRFKERREFLNNTLESPKVRAKILLFTRGASGTNSPRYEFKKFSLLRKEDSQCFIVAHENSRGSLYFQTNIPFAEAPTCQELVAIAMRRYLEENPNYLVYLTV
jgi:hypothetical protein